MGDSFVLNLLIWWGLSAQGRRMISLAHSCLWVFGVLFHILGSLSLSLKILGIIPEKQTYALQRTYLERGSVHVGIQLCTHVYTHPSSVGGIRWGSLHLGHGYFYLRRMLLDDLAPW